MKTGGDTSERQACTRKTCEREREEGGDSQLLRAEDDLFFFNHSLVWKRRKHLQLLPPKKERKKESFVSLCSLERSARSSLEERSIWILL